MVSTAKSKYEQIQMELSQQIRQETWRPGDKLPSEQELATSYGVSRLTVRQAIGGLITAGLVQSIQGKGSFVSEKSQPRAALKTVHLLASTFHTQADEDMFATPFLSHLGREATRRGSSLCISLLPRHLSFREFIRKNGIPPTFENGVILNNIAYDAEDLAMLERERIAYVTMPWKDQVAKGPRVGSDGVASMRMCVENLLRHGHRDIGLVNCPVGYTDFENNLEAYGRTLTSAGISINPRNIATASPVSEEDGRYAADQLLGSNPRITAAVLFGDRAAAGFLRQLARRNINVPGDFSVAVHDRYRWMDSAFPCRPSGTQQNIEGIAHAVLDALDQQRASGVTEDFFTRVAPDWIDGNSMAFTTFGVTKSSRKDASL